MAVQCGGVLSKKDPATYLPSEPTTVTTQKAMFSRCRRLHGAAGAALGIAAAGAFSAARCESDAVAAEAAPRRFLDACSGDGARARARWSATQAWRREHRVDELLRMPQPHYHLIKRHFPHAIVGRDPLGRPVVVERCGGARAGLKRLRAEDILPADIVWHQIFLHEWMWGTAGLRRSEGGGGGRRGQQQQQQQQQPQQQSDDSDADAVGREPSVSGQAIRVYDCAGVSARDAVCGKARDYFRRMDVVGEHYPERVARVFVVNAPPWFALAWDFCAPLIPPRTKAKLAVCAGPSPPELLAVVGAAALPRCYGGENDCAFGESAEEQALEGFVEQLNGGGRAGQGGAGCGVAREPHLVN